MRIQPWQRIKNLSRVWQQLHSRLRSKSRNKLRGRWKITLVGYKRPCQRSPWSNTNLNRILLSHATQNVTATFAFMQKLSQAKNFQDAAKIQTEFMQMQMNSFNEQAKILGEIYTNAAQDAMKTPFGMPK